MFQVMILVFAIVLFTFLAFNRVGAGVMAAVVGILTCILAGLPISGTMLGGFMDSASGYVKSYFFVFFFGALFSAVYEESGAARSIANTLTKLTHGKHIPSVIFICTAILTYGGISGFVIYFVMYPICLQMWKKNDLSRILIPAAITAGCWTISMTLPGSPSVQNVIAMKSLGTSSTAALLPGIITSIAELVAIIAWFEYRERHLRKKGRHFDDPTLPPLPAHELGDDTIDESSLPSPLVSFLPIILILGLFNIGGYIVEIAVFWGILFAIVLFWKHLDGGIKTLIDCLNRGSLNCYNALLNTAIVVGFGGVAKQTEGFQIVVNSMLDLDMNPLIFVAIATAVCAGVCGSASGGMGVAFDALKSTFIGLGVNLEYAHRIAAIAAGTLDTLPHQGGQMTIYALTHMNHKNAYLDICVTQLIIPLLSLFICIPLCAMGL